MTQGDKQVNAWLSDEVAKLQSESQQEDWLTLREAINDKSLMSVPDDVFTLHMQFIHLQLLKGCAVKCCSGGLGEMMRNPERYMQHMDALTEPIRNMVHCIENGKNIAADYSNAYGSSPTSAAAAMIAVLQNKILNGAMSNSAAHFLEQHLGATNAAYKEAVERAYGAESRDETAKLVSRMAMSGMPSARKGQGCLVCIGGCAVAGWAVLELLHVISAS